MDASPYIHTDLAVEQQPAGISADTPGIAIQVYSEEGCTVTALEILDERGEQTLGKPVGMYYSIDIGVCWYDDAAKTERTAHCIAACLTSLLARHPIGERCVLVAGLGNRSITADRLGPLTADSVNVTRHLRDAEPELYRSLACSEVAGIAPGVAGQTGMESTEILSALVRRLQPGCVIAIDALAARSTDRLATTVQLSDTGIHPGSGIGNHRAAVNAESLGVPVLAIGVPTVVNSSTMVYDALEKAGVTEISDALRQVLDNGKSYFVSLKESDIAVGQLATILSRALNLALGNDYQ